MRRRALYFLATDVGIQYCHLAFSWKIRVMISRHVNLFDLLGKKSSAMLLGARGTGKTKLSQAWIATQQVSLSYNLLDPDEFKRLLSSPAQLKLEVRAALSSLSPEATLSVFIDEVQKIPALLDLCHLLIEEEKPRVRFLLTGSSARKLKSSKANLLASRALSVRLHPLTHRELADAGFLLDEVLRYGSIPAIYFAENKEESLRAYVDTYLKEEIQQEAMVRKLDKFFSFIDIAAQLNGEIVNYSKMARQIGVADKTIGDYYQILLDTLLLIRVPGWDRSAKKQIIKSSKFFFFDCGVLNAAARELRSPLQRGSSRYGKLFEQFVITEIYRLNDYFRRDYVMSFYSNGSSEVDVVLSRSRREAPIAIEVKSNPVVHREDLSGLALFASEYPESPLYCFSTNDKPYDLEIFPGRSVRVLHYRDGIAAVLEIS